MAHQEFNPFEVSTDSGGDRLPFSFTGQVSTPLSVDATEFRGWPVPRITAELKSLLSGIQAGVSYFDDELEMAAEAIVTANGERP